MKEESLGELWFKFRRIWFLYFKMRWLMLRLTFTSQYNQVVIDLLNAKAIKIKDEIEKLTGEKIEL